MITDDTTHDVSYYKLPEVFSVSTLSPTGTSHLSALAANGDAACISYQYY